MDKENIKNIIILKNLPSNLIDEAIMVIKDKKKTKDFNYSDLATEQEEYNEKHKVIQGYMNEEDLKKIEKIKKENRKYVIKEAEMVVTNYINKMDNSLDEKKAKKIEGRYKRLRILNIFLGLTTIVSISFAIIF